MRSLVLGSLARHSLRGEPLRAQDTKTSGDKNTSLINELTCFLERISRVPAEQILKF